MCDSERMVALKKAYAEMILNTAKEAAMRVTASERKAVRFQKELCSTKDEALRLLLRLKQMIDAKTIEAEITSSSRQSKIDVLEAQLQEAEGVIIDLRAELKWVRDKLEKVRNGQMQPLNGKTTKDDELTCQNATPEVITLYPNSEPENVKSLRLDHRILDNDCCNATEETEKLSVPHSHGFLLSDQAPIIMRKDEPVLYRNGFMQRISASEENLPAAELPDSKEVVHQHSLAKNVLIIRESDNKEGNFNLPSPKTKNMERTKYFTGAEVRKRAMIQMLQRRKARSGKANAKHRSPVQPMKSYQMPSILSRCRKVLPNGDAKSVKHSNTLPPIQIGNMDIESNGSEIQESLECKSSCSVDEKMIAHEGETQRKEQNTDAISASFTSRPGEATKTSQPSSLLNQCKTYSFLVNGKVTFGQDQPGTTDKKVRMKPLPRLDPGLTLIKGGVNPLSGSANATVRVKALNRPAIVKNATNKDMESADELVKKKHNAAAKSTVLSRDMNPEAVNLPLACSESKDGNEETIANVPVMYSDLQDAKDSKEYNNKPLKYTFQRKRKKEALSNLDQNASLENSNGKRRAAGKQDDPQISSLINESSRDSRRLAQVARQLISLSGKKLR